jgi:uncharacterized membrane protein YozB (DUF420 family)
MASLMPVIGGIIGPLLAALATWIVVTRAHRRNPAAVMNVMLAAFLAKAVFFGVYVVVMIKVLELEPVPFIVSFTAAFVTLYAVQGFLFARLFRQAGAGAS